MKAVAKYGMGKEEEDDNSAARAFGRFVPPACACAPMCVAVRASRVVVQSKGAPERAICDWILGVGGMRMRKMRR